MLLLPQRWLSWHYFVLGCFAPRSVDVGWGQYNIFVFLVLSREWRNAVSSRFPCLIAGEGRFLTSPRVVEIQWEGEEGRERGILNVGCVKMSGHGKTDCMEFVTAEEFWSYLCVMSCYWPVWAGLRSKWCCGHKEGRHIATHQVEKSQPNFSRP